MGSIRAEAGKQRRDKKFKGQTATAKGKAIWTD
jgi:hypothetical protein